MNEAVAPTSTRWKRWFIIGAGVGAGVTITAAIIMAIVVWYSTQPVPLRPWDREAITATFADLYLTKKGETFVFTFRYTLVNLTRRDWVLPGADALYKVLANDKGLERDATLRWDGGPSIPSGQRINVGVQIEYEYTETSKHLDKLNEFMEAIAPPPTLPRDFFSSENRDKRLNEFMERRLEEIDGFAALDEANRYDLRLPKPPKVK